VALELAELVAPAHTALVTQEIQRGVIGDLSALPELAKEGRRIVPNIVRLCAAARARGVRVIHCTAIRRSDGLGANTNARIFQYMARAEPKLIPGSPAAEIVPEVAVAESDLVLARIHGHCIGAGLELAASCDLRIASEAARFSMPEVRLGIPSVVEAALLARLVGPGRARWLVMTGEAIHAEEALAWGLVEKLVPADRLDAAVDAALDSILACGAEAIRAQKRLCKLWEEAPLEASVRTSIEEFARAYETDEPRRRIAEFRAAKRRR